MGVQIVHYKDDFPFVWVNFCQQASDFLCPVQFCPAFTHTGMAPSCKGFCKYKYAACPAAFIFGIWLSNVARPCRQRLAHFPASWYGFSSMQMTGTSGLYGMEYTCRTSSMQATNSAFSFGGMHQYSFIHGLSSFF